MSREHHRLHHQARPGGDHANASLTNEQAWELRRRGRLRVNGRRVQTIRSLALEFGICETSAGRIIAGLSYPPTPKEWT